MPWECISPHCLQRVYGWLVQVKPLPFSRDQVRWSPSWSLKSHDKGTRAEGANGGRVAKWPCSGKKGGRKAGTGGIERIKAAEESEESTDDSSGPVLVNWRDVASWKRPNSHIRNLQKPTLFLPRSSHWWPISQHDFSRPNFLPADACLQTMWYSIYSASELHLTGVSSISLHVCSSGAKFCKRLAS